MPRAASEAGSFQPFFRGLRERAVAQWQSPAGLAYDGVLYAMHYPYTERDLDRILAWVGRPRERAALPEVGALNRQLERATYPSLADKAPAGVSAEAWSAVLHFCDPSYPLYTEPAASGLKRLGFAVPPREAAHSYAAFMAAVDSLKDGAPAWSIPETNWYLARVIEAGLSSWGGRRPAAVSKRAIKARA